MDSAGGYRVNCTFPPGAEGWLYLYQDGQFFAETRLQQDGKMPSFNLTEGAFNVTKGELSCRYKQTERTQGREIYDEIII